MSELLSFLSLIFSGLGYFEILLILFGSRIHEDYFVAIMHPQGTIDNKAQAMFLFFVLAFMCLVLKEGIDYYKSKYPGSPTE